MKRIMSLLLSLLTLLSVLSGYSINAFALDKKGLAGENSVYTFNSATGVLTISGRGEVFDFDWAEDDGLWDESPFNSNSKIKKVIIKNGITGVRAFAFNNCVALKSITLPKSFKHINCNSFEGCPALETIKVSKDNPKFDSRNNCNAIINTKQNRLVKGSNKTIIPDTVERIAFNSFHNCKKLKKIHIPKSVIRIESGAFSGNSAVETITVDKDNKYYSAPNGCNAVINDKNWLTVGCKNTVIPDYVKGIYDSAFADCKGLKSITLGSKFTGSITAYKFRGCNALNSIKVSADNPKYDSRDNCNAIIETETNTLLAGCKTTIIPDTVETLGDYALAGDYTCCDLTGIDIPSSVTYINKYAFHNCKKLNKVKLPDNLETIDLGVFEGCTAIESLKLPKKLRVLSDNAFHKCSKLKSIDFPDKLEYIGSGAFTACRSLQSIYVGKNLSRIKMSAFSYCPKLSKISVSPQNTVYDSRKNCNAIVKTKINAIMLGCKNTTIPTSVKRIYESAFKGCKSLESIEIPDTVINIGDGAFADCIRLKSVKLPKRLNTVQSNLFSGCKALKKITIPASVDKINEYAFSNCPRLKSIKVSKSNKTLDSRNNCNAVVITKTDTLIVGCTGTAIPKSVKTIGKNAFAGCTGLKRITVPYGVEKIDTYAFLGCNKLVSVSIKKSIKSIEPAAFSGCDKLTAVYYSGSCSDWQDIDIAYKWRNNEMGPFLTNGMLKKAVVFYNSSPLKVKSTKPVTKGFKVKWSKLGGAKGYQIQYSTSSSFKNAKRLTVKGNKTFTKTVKKLKKNKKYYVRVRGYKTKKSIKTFGAWSQYKTVKTN